MKKLTKKQREFVKEYVKDENGVRSALVAYNVKNKNVAGNIASENLNKPNIREVLIPLLKKHELTLDRALRNVSEALDASDPITDKEGKVIGKKKNHAIRLQASDRVMKLHGVGSSETVQHLHLHKHADI